MSRNTKPASPSDPKGSFWLKQNTAKDSLWSKMAQRGREVYHLVSPPYPWQYHGKIMIDGNILTYEEARKWTPSS